MRKHHGVGWGMRAPGDAHDRLAHGVMHGEAGRAGRVARQDRTEPKCAGADREPESDLRDRAQRRILGDRVRKRCVERFDRMCERVDRAGRESRHRLRGHQPRLRDHQGRTHEIPLVDARRHSMERGHLRPRERGRNRRDPEAVGTSDRLGGIDHATAAEGHDRPAPHLSPHRGRDVGYRRHQRRSEPRRRHPRLPAQTRRPARS